MKSSQVLDAVERWAPGMVLIREIGGLVEGRLDGLLVPVSREAMLMNGRGRDVESAEDYFFERAGLIGVEVKVDRSDWMRGLKQRQLQRYMESKALAGVYVAAPRGIVKKDEVPEGVGILTVFSPYKHTAARAKPPGCVCARAPTWKRAILSHGVLWRLLFRMHEMEVARAREWKQAEFLLGRRIKEQVAARLDGPLSRIIESAKADLG